MALIKCNECGKEIPNNAKICPNCGNPIKLEGKENDYKSEKTKEQILQKIQRKPGKTKEQILQKIQRKLGKTKEQLLQKIKGKFKNTIEQALQKVGGKIGVLKIVLIIVAIVLAIIGGICIKNGFDVKDHYYSSEKFPNLNRYAYVGGDAYNYIINANYFTGYIVLGSSLFVCSAISIATSVLLRKKSN